MRGARSFVGMTVGSTAAEAGDASATDGLAMGRGLSRLGRGAANACSPGMIRRCGGMGHRWWVMLRP